MPSPSIVSTIRSEWIKFRSVRSTPIGYVVTAVLTIGLGILITVAIRSHWHTMDPLARIAFDPVATSLAGVLFAQFAIGVIGILYFSNEYATGSIRPTLAATPRRSRVVVAKVVVLTGATLVVAEIVAIVTFLIGQRIYAGVVPTASLGTPAVLRSVLLGGLYLTLLALLGLGLGLLIRHQSAAISVYTTLLLILPIIVIFLPSSWQTTISRYEPSSLGRAMMSVAPPDQMFGAWTAALVLTLYVVGVLGAATMLLEKRDA